MKYNIGQAVGLNTDQQAALVLSSQSEGETFLAVCKLTCDDAFTKGRQILSELEDLYHEEEGTTAQKLQQIFPKAEEKFAETEKYDLLLAATFGKVVYFIRQGEIEVYLRRGGKLSSLSELASPKQLISGFLTEGDRLFFATSSLVSFLADSLEATLQLALSEWEEETNSKIGSVTLEDQGLAGLVVDVAGETPSSSLEPASLPEDNLGSPSTSAHPPLGGFGALLAKFKRDDTAVAEGSDADSETGKPKFSLGKIIPQSKKSRLLLGLVLILVLMGGIGLQYKKNRDQERDQAFSELLQSARDSYSAAEGLSALNPAETKNKLKEAKDSLTKALELKSTDAQAQELQKKLSENTDKLIKQFSAANFPLFLDLDLVKSGFKANWMSLSGTNLLLLDPNSDTLVSIDSAKKSHKILAGKEQLGEGDFATLANFAFVYSSKGVLRVDSSSKVTTVAKADKDLTGAVDIAGFGSNVYLLAKGGNQIWKYTATSDGYSDKKEYLGSGVKADFADSRRMQIESSVYILKANGQILRYTRGTTDSFNLTGLDQGLKDPKSFFTSSDVENLYILDSGNSRLVVVDKKGAYKAQYQGDKFAQATDMVADEKGKKVYLLDGSKIYSMDLK